MADLKNHVLTAGKEEECSRLTIALSRCVNTAELTWSHMLSIIKTHDVSCTVCTVDPCVYSNYSHPEISTIHEDMTPHLKMLRTT